MQILISHSAKDASLAVGVGAELACAGFRVWNPAEEIAPGDNWASKIGQALDESDLMIALITPGAFDSESLRGNIQFALTSRKFEHRLVPVLVGPTFVAGKDIPWILLKLDPIYVPSPSHGFDEVVRRVRDIAGQEAHVAR